MTDTETKEYCHELVDRLLPGQLSAVASFMESLLDPGATTAAERDHRGLTLPSRHRAGGIITPQ